MATALSNQTNTITDAAQCVARQNLGSEQKGAAAGDEEGRNMALLALAISGGLLVASIYIALF